jgi:cell division septum initiation protein DivIVA
MLRFEETVEGAEESPRVEESATVERDDARLDEVNTDSTDVPGPAAVVESPTGAAARMLEVAAVTAEEIVSIAQAHAEAILEASRQEANEAEAELDRKRTTTLAGLADEKAELESQITTLRSLHDDHRSQMRRHLTQQLELLDHTASESSAAEAV